MTLAFRAPVAAAAQAETVRHIALRLADQGGVEFSSDGATVLSNPFPIEVGFAAGDAGAEWVTAPYAHVRREGDVWVAQGEARSTTGSQVRCTDRYEPGPDGWSMTVHRSVVVVAAIPPEDAFNSRLRLFLPEGQNLRDMEVFVPGVWYRDPSHLRDTALAAHYEDGFILIREDRLPLPLVMARFPPSGATCSLLLTESNPLTTLSDRGLNHRVIDAGLQFASLGIDQQVRPALTLMFPGSEGQRTYIWGAKLNSEKRRVALRSHPLRAGMSHSYAAVLRAARTPSFAVAVKATWRSAYSVYSPPILHADQTKVYGDGIDLLDMYWERSGGVPGFPFSVKVPSGEVYKRSLQMGFIGQQIPCAYYLLREALLTGDRELRRKGEAIVDFWATRSLTDFGMPRVWWDVKPWNRWRLRYPTYLRIACEGMEGMLSAWRVAHRHGQEHAQWLDACRRFGDWLVRTQNGDGSFYRCYTHDGGPGHHSKSSTIVVARFLSALYRVTGGESYRRCAQRAGEYAWRDVHQPACYVGGTPDNPNVRDKEACVLAMTGFLALHGLTGQRRWLEAACQAADFTETWLYCRNIPLLADEPRRTLPLGRQTTGLSLIATGHSGCDSFLSYNSFDFCRLYRLTGDAHYLRIAQQLLHNTKQTLDWDGRLGYAHPGLQIEACTLAPPRGSSVGVWLPWVTAANIDPLVRMEEMFGTMDIGP